MFLGLRDDHSPAKGILVDYLGDFTRSARGGLPVFAVSGESGYVWVANYDEQGRGTLRFFAINPAKLTPALIPTNLPQSQPAVVSAPAVTVTREQKNTTLERQLDECGDSCLDKPELDSIRLATLKQLEEAKTRRRRCKGFQRCDPK